MNCGSDLLFGIITMANQPCVDLFGVVSTRSLLSNSQSGVISRHTDVSITHCDANDRIFPNDGTFCYEWVRSSGSGSYIGIDGESLVWQIQLAEMNYLWNANDHQIRFSAGINEDFWVKTNNEIWGLRGISWGVAERQFFAITSRHGHEYFVQL